MEASAPHARNAAHSPLSQYVVFAGSSFPKSFSASASLPYLKDSHLSTKRSRDRRAPPYVKGTWAEPQQVRKLHATDRMPGKRLQNRQSLM